MRRSRVATRAGCLLLGLCSANDAQPVNARRFGEETRAANKTWLVKRIERVYYTKSGCRKRL